MAKGSSSSRRRRRRRRNLRELIPDLPDTLIIEILSRLPPESLCRCKCVSTRWYFLISDPDNRKKLPQTLAGFFFDTKDRGRSPKVARHFQNVDWQPPLIDPSFPFLPPEFERVELLDTCDGLLLCSTESPFRLFVCNPATEKWVMVPDSGCVGKTDVLALAFDRDISPLFHIFCIVRNTKYDAVGAMIYSSKTSAWSYKEGGWGYKGGGWNNIELIDDRGHVFHNGLMHYVSSSAILVVDTEGKKWRTIPLPHNRGSYDQLGNVGQSQGHLYYLSDRGLGCTVSIWFLEKYHTDEWTLKHRVDREQLLNAGNQAVYTYQYKVISGHPNCSWIYYANIRGKSLMAYDIGREEAHEAHVFGSFGRGSLRSVFPYVPLYQETLVQVEDRMGSGVSH